MPTITTMDLPTLKIAKRSPRCGLGYKRERIRRVLMDALIAIGTASYSR